MRPLDALEFETVSVDDAARVHRGEDGAAPTVKKPKATYVRRPLMKGDMTLLPEAKRWVGELPRELRPLNTAAQYPRIANQLALTWGHDPKECRRLLEDLVIDKRGDRAGFPQEVMHELVQLKVRHDTRYPPDTPEGDVWEPAILRRRA